MVQYFTVFKERAWAFVSDNKVVVAIAGLAGPAVSASVIILARGSSFDWWLIVAIIGSTLAFTIGTLAFIAAVETVQRQKKEADAFVPIIQGATKPPPPARWIAWGWAMLVMLLCLIASGGLTYKASLAPPPTEKSATDKILEELQQNKMNADVRESRRATARESLKALIAQGVPLLEACCCGPSPKCQTQRKKWESSVDRVLLKIDPSYASRWRLETAKNVNGVVLIEVQNEIQMLIDLLKELQ